MAGSSADVYRARSRRRSFALTLTYVFWILVLFSPDWFLTGTIGGPFFRIPTLVAPVLVMLVIARFDRRTVYWPLILFVLLHIGASFLSEDQGRSREAFKFMFYVVLLFAVSVTFLDSPAKMIVVLKLYLLSFVWYGLQGLSDGRVQWHFNLANEDSYGPLMAMAVGFSRFAALSMHSRRWRVMAGATCVLGILGVVVSFARGAALALAAVLLHVWLRSPRRLAALTQMTAAGAVIAVVAAAFVPLDQYVTELKTISEGTQTGTGQHRWVLWQMGWEVFLSSPIYGVGADNFSVVAFHMIPYDPTRPYFSNVQRGIYGFWLHNDYIQVLCEEGIIGIALWTGMIVGFFRRIRRLRREDAAIWWARRGGAGVDVRMIARGLEGAMVGYLVSAVFYGQVYFHWFWSLMTMAYVLVLLSSPPRRGAHAERSNERLFSRVTTPAWSH
jgi:O-antigen ligase